MRKQDSTPAHIHSSKMESSRYNSKRQTPYYMKKNNREEEGAVYTAAEKDGTWNGKHTQSLYRCHTHVMHVM